MEKFNNCINAVMAFIDKIFEKISNISFLNTKLSNKTIATVFGIIVFIIATVSGIFIIGEITSDKPEDTTADTTTQVSATITPDSELCANFLLALTYHDDIELLAVARVNSSQRQIRLSFLSPDTYCSFNNLTGTMNQHYKKGGITELMWAVGEYAHISIERYILSDENTFLNLINHIGEMEVTLEHDVICGQDAASFIIEEGQQNLIPAMMTKYFYYLCENQPIYNDEIVDVMALYSKKLFCTEDEEKTKANFEYLISCIETNISALDFTNYKSSIYTLANPLILDCILVEEDITNLR